jgi:hypothetical protein
LVGRGEWRRAAHDCTIASAPEHAGLVVDDGSRARVHGGVLRSEGAATARVQARGLAVFTKVSVEGPAVEVSSAMARLDDCTFRDAPAIRAADAAYVVVRGGKLPGADAIEIGAEARARIVEAPEPDGNASAQAGDALSFEHEPEWQALAALVALDDLAPDPSDDAEEDEDDEDEDAEPQGTDEGAEEGAEDETVGEEA